MSSKKSEHDPKHWKVHITIDEKGERARAVAEMRYRGETFTGIGQTRLDPGDHFPDEVGEELAIARALSDLAQKVFETTATDIEEVVGEEVSVR